MKNVKQLLMIAAMLFFIAFPSKTNAQDASVTICDQVWMLKNLDVSTYRNGDPIPQVTDPSQWAGLTTGAWCYYENNSANGPIYGKLYNWYAVNDPRGLAPLGWQVPSYAELTTLETCLGGSSVAGGALKESGTAHWLTPNTGATNSSGWTGLPGGFRYDNGTFIARTTGGIWWSTTEGNAPFVLARHLTHADADFSFDFGKKTHGFSVRCIRANTAPVFSLCPDNQTANTSAWSCSAVVNYVATTSGTPVADITYTFTGATSGSGSGTGSGAEFNIGTTNVTIAATNSYGTANCTFTVTVTDNVMLASQTVCNNTATAPVNFSASVPGTVFNWTNSNSSIGLAASGTGNIASFTAINTGTTPVTATVTVTPSTGGSSGSFAYVPNSAGDNKVYVFNIATNTIVATVPVGGGPLGVAVSPDGTRVYVTISNSNTVSVINTASNTVVATVNVGENPQGVAVSPDGSRVFVTTARNNRIDIINTATNTVIATISSGGGSPAGVAVSPDGSRFYVTNSNSDNVAIFNTSTYALVATVQVGGGPRSIIVSPDGSRLYVANYLTQNVTVINTVINLVVATIPVGGPNAYGPVDICIKPDGSRVYVVNKENNNMAVINTFTNMVVATVAVGLDPHGISITPDGNWVYVTNRLSSNISVINTATNTVVATVSGIPGPWALGNFITSVGILTCAGTPKTFTITVNPTPAIICPGNQTANTAPDNCSAVVNYTAISPTTPAPTITYAFTGATTGSGSGTGSGSTFNTGTTTVTNTATNSCGSANCTFTVTVNDNQPPVISCASDISVTATSAAGAMVTYTTPVGTDNCSGSTTTRIAGPASGATFPIGVTSVTHQVTDGAGLTAQCSFTVTVTAVTVVVDQSTNVNCNGANNGSIDVTVNGGTAPYIFAWTKDNVAGFSSTEDLNGISGGTYQLTVTDVNGSVATTTPVIITEPPVLTASANGTNINCFGGSNGSAMVIATGGTGSYTYLWSNAATTNSISGLTAGIYTVTVSDANGCTAQSSYEVTQPIQLTASAGGTNASCFGGSNGSATVTASGGTGAYSYLWSNGATTQNISNLFAGIYTVTVSDANGCTAQSGYEVTQPTQLTTLAGGTNVSCFGGSNGSATVTASGGTGAYSYLWSNGATTQNISNLIAGIYTVTVFDANGCIAQSTHEVTQPAQLIASAGGNNVSCFGGSNGAASVIANGGTQPYSYLWSNNATSSSIINLSAGVYSVTVTDAHGCTQTTAYTVTQPALLTVTMTGTTANCNGSATATAAGGTTPYIYLWSNGATTQSINSLSAGIYTVTVTDAHNCIISGSFTITGSSPINPTASLVHVSCFGGSNGAITVIGAGGTSPHTYNINGSLFQPGNIFNNLSAGAYIVGAKDANGCVDFVTKTITQPALLTVVLDSVRTSCYTTANGRIYITATGGTGTKNYNWAGPNGYTSTAQDPNNLLAGNYTVTVTDAKGCTANLNVTLPEWPAINIVETITHVLCHGDFTGAINATITGGTVSGLSFAWNGPGTYAATTEDISGLKAGNYKITVTDNGSGCLIQKTIVVTQPANNLAVAATKTNVDGCNPGSITATASGGTGPYQYSIDGVNYQSSGLFSNLAGAVYTIHAKDNNGCSITKAVTITDNGSDDYEGNNTKNQAKLITIGTVISARIAEATDLADWFKITTASADNYILSLTHPSASFTFNMYPAGNNAPALTPIATTPGSKTYTLAGGTTYYISVTDGLSNVCYQLSVTTGIVTRINGTLKTETKKPDESLPAVLAARVYPNPHQGSFTLEIESPEDGMAVIELFNSTGQKVGGRSGSVKKGPGNTIYFSNIRNAVLFYRLRIGKHIMTGKIIGPN